jgi:hypothetical protein
VSLRITFLRLCVLGTLLAGSAFGGGWKWETLGH